MKKGLIVLIVIRIVIVSLAGMVISKYNQLVVLDEEIIRKIGAIISRTTIPMMYGISFLVIFASIRSLLNS